MAKLHTKDGRSGTRRQDLCEQPRLAAASKVKLGTRPIGQGVLLCRMNDESKPAELLGAAAAGSQSASQPVTALPEQSQPHPTAKPTESRTESPVEPSAGPSTEPPAYSDNPYINHGGSNAITSDPNTQATSGEIDFPILDPDTARSRIENEAIYSLLNRFAIDPTFSPDAPLPTYTPLDSSFLPSLLHHQPSLSTLLSLPLTTYPESPYPYYSPSHHRTIHPSPTSSSPLAALEDEDLKRRYYNLQRQIVSTFFHAITHGKNTELVTQFVKSGFISPDCPDATGSTPLVAAVEAGNGQMVCLLIGLGAQVNGYGKLFSGAPRHRGKYADLMLERTPLMVAARNGNLALVKLLVDEFGADDGVIAPDGQLALRLAAEGGHREVVEYLPTRRGGAWRRWKTHHSVAVERVRRAGRKIGRFVWFFVWELPRFLVWSVPKHVVVKPVVKAVKYCWENKRRFGGWVKREVKGFPGRVKRVGKEAWKGLKKLPRGVWEVMKEIPGMVKRLGIFIWKVIKKIPELMKNLCVWIWMTLKKLGMAVGNIFLKVISVLHTAVAAVLDYFRSISLKDIWNGVEAVFRAIFIGLPQAIWSGLVGLVKCVGMSILALFGLSGQILIWLFEGLCWVVTYIPNQLGKIISAIWASISKGYYEIMVWINPKH
ncbi:hypothetical protein QBC41DRAFT_386621 [Cercophora samala]|uniref:Ankyrin n=1 Tax=Cercophora samala TaxID=330535 RepID=A0AA39ZHJ6_9PEZI|nr:hypothetical protein QBC41DRAFT_386621 [Cercophora samala]